MTLDEVYSLAIKPALALLPPQMTSREAVVMLLASGAQESSFKYRVQLGDGPARGLWQFEPGTSASRGGVWGVYLHDASRFWLAHVCSERAVPFNPDRIWRTLADDDVLAAAVARLLLFTDRSPLPLMSGQAQAWNCYQRNWRPGKPRPDDWPANHTAAVQFVKEKYATP